VSIHPRLLISDNSGACPCLPPLDLGRLLDRVYRATPQPTAMRRVVAALAKLRKKVAR
jgi:hypothetical protein